MANETPKMFKTLLKYISNEINVSQYARVIALNSNGTANVQPLASNPDGSVRPMWINVRVPKNIEVSVNDTVLVLFQDIDTDALENNQVYMVHSPRTHSYNDAAIVGVY